MPYRDIVKAMYPMFGYSFVPLVREQMSLQCNLDILLLRRDMPGGVLHAGDIDNRIKTLIDGLRMPKSVNELSPAYSQPSFGEDPFYVLMEEDKLVSGFSVETDLLLAPSKSPNRDTDLRWVQAIISVELKPYVATSGNMDFV